MKALVVAVILLPLSVGAASAALHPSLRPLRLTPPIFRGSGFRAHERVTVSVRGSSAWASPVHVVANAQGRFRVRLAAVPVCTTWTARAVGAGGQVAVYHHARCAALAADVEGIVRRQTGNVCTDQSQNPCTGPAAGATVQAFLGETLVAQTTTDENGRFTFALAAGDYTFVPIGQGAKPMNVQVTPSAVAHVEFLIDTALV